MVDASPRDILLARQGGAVHGGVHEQGDMVDDKELLELVEMEVRELLTLYKFPGEKTRSSSVSAKRSRGTRASLGCPRW